MTPGGIRAHIPVVDDALLMGNSSRDVEIVIEGSDAEISCSVMMSQYR